MSRPIIQKMGACNMSNARMPDKENVLQALYGCSNVQSGFTDAVYICPTCLYGGDDGRPCESLHPLLDDAFTLLKAQEPRVMTLEDIRVIYHRREDHVWPFDTPPYLWVETNGRTVPYWMSWNNVIACQEGQFPKYDPDDYGKSWRCWTSRPTDAQREATPWENTPAIMRE